MRIALFIVFFFAATFGFSQHVYVGRVCDKDTKQPLRNVVIKLDSIVTHSNAAGFFQIVSDTAKLLTAELKGYEKVYFKLPTSVGNFIFYLKKLKIGDITLMKSFYSFIGQAIRYPSEARKESVQGVSLTYFKIDTLGRIIYIDILKKVNGGCSEEVIRVLKKSPNVLFDAMKCFEFVLPVVFQIIGEESPVKKELESLPTMPNNITVLSPIVVSAEVISRTYVR